MAADHMKAQHQQRFEVAPDLRAEISVVMTACRELCPKLVAQAASRNPDAAHSIGNALGRGDRLMVAFDVDGPDPMLRVLTIGADQVATQHVACGAIAPSERRN